MGPALRFYSLPLLPAALWFLPADAMLPNALHSLCQVSLVSMNYIPSANSHFNSFLSSIWSEQQEKSQMQVLFDDMVSFGASHC